MNTFIDDCLNGISRPSHIDDYIESWHNSPFEQPALHEYLGLTQKEYNCWVEGSRSIEDIVFDHMVEEIACLNQEIIWWESQMEGMS